MTTTPLPDPKSSLRDGCHLVAGQWREASTGERIDVIDPSTGDVIHRVPRGRQVDVDAAVRAAADAATAWRDMNPTERARLLRTWADLCTANREGIAALESREVGKPLAHSRRTTAGLMEQIHYYAGLTDKVTGTTLPVSRPDMLGLTLREPYGVCGVIVPWNAPGILMMGEVAPALAAGNTVVLKPAEDAPLTCLYLAALALEAGIPPGVLEVVTGYGSEAGAALANHPRIRHMAFTGSPEAGSEVMAACARSLIPLRLELGGKSPHVVFDDADVARAVPAIVRSLLYNTGQTCFAGTRLLAGRAVHAELVDAIARELRKARVGAWYEDVDMGPLINASQERRVLGYIASAVDEGARLVTGGRKVQGDRYEPGFFVEPTLFDDVTPAMRIAQEEVFGPVLSVMRFGDPEEALEIANGTRYGLAAAVWTRDVAKALRIARSIQAGQVYINTYGFQDVIGAPFGGSKQSGFGRTHGQDAILAYTQQKTVIIDARE